MPTVSAHIDKDLKDKLTSKAHKEAKSVSDLVKEALNEIDFDKEEFNEVDEEPKIKESLRNEIKETVAPLQQKIEKLEKQITTLEQLDHQFCNIAKSLTDIVSENKLEHSKAINQLITGLSRNSVKIGELDAHLRNDRRNIKSIKRDLLDAQRRLMNKGLEAAEGVAKRLR